MKPESAAFLRKARDFQGKARGMADTWPDEAGRAAYLAGFHGAQALIFELTGSAPKTHGGVHAQFARLTRGDRQPDAELRGFLGRAYNLKAVADYETGSGIEITRDQAERAMRSAARFVDWVTALLEPG